MSPRDPLSKASDLFMTLFQRNLENLASSFPALTHNKCYRAVSLDKEPRDSLTHNRGYQDNDNEY